MTDTPRGSPELAEGQALLATTVNEQIRRTEAGAGRFPVADRVTAPPGTCSDGANYIIIATATGDFAGKEGQIATAVGANAASGWLYRTMGAIDEGAVAYVQDEDVEYKWSGSAWAVYGGAGYSPGGVDVAVADGGTGASTASAARANLDVYSKAEVDSAVSGSGLSAASSAEVRTGTSTTKAVTPGALADASAPQTLTDMAIVTWNMANGFNAKWTLGGNRTLTVSNPKEGWTYSLNVIQDGTGNRTVTWPSSFDWGGTGAPTLSATANKRDRITLFCTDAATPKFDAFLSGRGFS